MAKKVKSLSRGTYAKYLQQRKWWPLYFRRKLDATVQKYQFFTEHVGEGGLTYADTNMELGAQIPKGQKHTVYYLAAYYQPQASKTIAELQNIRDFLTSTWIDFSILNLSPQLTVTLGELFGNPMPLHVGGGAVGDQLMSQSVYNGVYEFVGKNRITLAQQITFRIDMESAAAFNASLTDDYLMFSLIGQLRATTG